MTDHRQSKPQTEPQDAERLTQVDQFARQATERSTGLLVELFDLLRFNKKWWLAPIILSLLLVTLLIVLASTGAAPFIYTLF